MPLNAWKNSLRSVSRSSPVTRFRTAEGHRAAAANHPGGEAGRLHEHLHASALDELGEPLRRIQEVEGIARWRGVEDEEVIATLLMDLEELLHRHVLLRAGEGIGELAIDPVLEDPVARLGVRRMLADELVEGCLGVEHHRPELAASSRRRNSRTASDRPGEACSRVPWRPSESASRLAGSIVSTATFWPRAARPAASAAEAVVLPTPPEPAQMQIPRPSTTWSIEAIRPRPPRAAPARATSRLRLEDERQRLDREATALLSGAAAARAASGASMLGERRP